MSELIHLESVELVPVIELEPARFSRRERSPPSGLDRELPERWGTYWNESLADSGVVGLVPLGPASWLVTTRQLTDTDLLGRILSIVVREWGGPEVLLDPDGTPALEGGFALHGNGELLLSPTCCGDLGDFSSWHEAAAHRSSAWKMVWIGHPWLSVRFDGGWLVFSGLHESESPVGKWMVRPEELRRAVAAAKVEVEKFAWRLEPIVARFEVDDPVAVSRRIVGLPEGGSARDG
jgi:hypothetical protein